MALGAADHYTILGVTPEQASDDAKLRRAYRARAHMVHPDRNHASGAEAAFKRVAEAFEVLSDKGKRADYDRSGRRPSARPSAHSHTANGRPPYAAYGPSQERPYDWAERNRDATWRQREEVRQRRAQQWRASWERKPAEAQAEEALALSEEAARLRAEGARVRSEVDELRRELLQARERLAERDETHLQETLELQMLQAEAETLRAAASAALRAERRRAAAEAAALCALVRELEADAAGGRPVEILG